MPNPTPATTAPVTGPGGAASGDRKEQVSCSTPAESDAAQPLLVKSGAEWPGQHRSGDHCEAERHQCESGLQGAEAEILLQQQGRHTERGRGPPKAIAASSCKV